MLPVLSPDLKIGIVGLGYVGLPLALAFSEKYNVIGYDLDEKRISALLKGYDLTSQVTNEELVASKMSFSNDSQSIADCQVYIITVPTPVDEDKKPDLSALLEASNTISKFLKRGDLVIYESTVYPGCTEEDCVPVLKKGSGLKYNFDFYCGYSPERVSPGDPVYTLKNIVKVTSGSNAEAAAFVNELYSSIILAGTHLAPSIKVAEASKAIENAQRDVNISFVNELALIFDKMGIDTTDVLQAAGTKWNFLNFKPGLVGGHCIGVDPYYLAHKAEKLGYISKVILSGRDVNDNMASFVVNKCIRLMREKAIPLKESKALILGITFKENCADIRNSKVIELINELIYNGLEVSVFDPVADRKTVKSHYNLELIEEFELIDYQLVILAVAHDNFLKFNFEQYSKSNTVLFDTRGVLARELVDGRL